MYSNLRFVASASLVALASLVGVLALFPDALEELVVASAETSDSPATACKQDWLRFDPSCLSRRGMPWIARSPDSNAIPSTREDAPAQPLTESPSAAAVPAEPVQQTEAAAPQQETPAPVAEERQSPTPTQRSEAAQQETPAPVADPAGPSRLPGRNASGRRRRWSWKDTSRSSGAKSPRLAARRRLPRDGAPPNPRPRRSHAPPPRRNRHPRIGPRSNGLSPRR